MDFLDAITAWGLAHPERIAHRSGEAGITYKALVGRAATLARWLDDTHVDDRRPVAIVGHREPQFLVAMLACALTNRAYVPIDDATPVERVERIAHTANVAQLLTVADVERLAPSESALPPRRPRHADDLFYVMFTSGSTGEPKGVQVTRGCLQAFLDWMTGAHALQPAGETFLNQANFSFDLSVMDLYLSLVSGGTLVSATREHAANPRLLFELLRTTPITTWVSTPTFAAMCLVERAFDQSMLPTLKRFLFCGEVLPHAVAASLVERFPSAEVWNTYGPTEATVATTAIRVTREVLDRHDPLPVGVAMPGTDVLVRDADGRPVPEGERGEIVIRGPNVSVGYLGREDLTRAAFDLEGPGRAYHSGDWGRYRDGLLFCEGRMDSQIKLHGYRIELGEIEVQLRRCGGVRDAVVLVNARDGVAHSLTAVVVEEAPVGATTPAAASEGVAHHTTAAGATTPSGATPSGATPRGATPSGTPGATASAATATARERTRAQELRGELARHLPAYMVPRKVRLVAQFPMTANGKVDRRALAEALTREP